MKSCRSFWLLFTTPTTTTRPSRTKRWARYRRAQRRDDRCGYQDFVGGLYPVKSAKSLRAQPGGKLLITDGPYLETKEHIGGFWMLEVTDMNVALKSGRKPVVACRAPVEVRQFHSL